MDASAFNPPRGMRDFYPEDMRSRNRLFTVWRDVAEQHGFAPYDACVVESLELLKRKSGEEIVDQIYTFTDKSGRDLALRPEMTPSLARMVVARQGALTLPIKWYAIAQCFRYERMSKGRKREHYQWNLDILGSADISAEVELLATALDALNRLGLGPDQVRVHYSSRALLSELLNHLGIDQPHHAATFLALDKLGKVDAAEIRTLLQAESLTPDAIDRVFELIALTTLDEVQARLGNTSPAIQSLRRFEELLGVYGLEKQVRFDLSIVRGLSYYTGIVFECFDVQRQFRALFGGGRYDNLLTDLGGTPVSGVGLGFGDVVVAELLATLPARSDHQSPPALALGYMTENERIPAMRIADAFRRQQVGADLGLQPEKAKAFFARAGAGHFTHAVYLGPDDIQTGQIRIKRLKDRAEMVRPVSNPASEPLE